MCGWKFSITAAYKQSLQAEQYNLIFDRIYIGIPQRVNIFKTVILILMYFVFISNLSFASIIKLHVLLSDVINDVKLF